MVEDWKAALQKQPTARLFREVTQAFKAAVATTKGEESGQCRYKVADSSGTTSSSLPSFNCAVIYELRIDLFTP